MTTTQRPRRIRTTRASVKAVDRIARNVIRAGGIGTIAAVSTVFLFLSWVVWPLLRDEGMGAARTVSATLDGEVVLATGPDDSRSTFWAYTSAGRFLAFGADRGERLAELRPFPTLPTAQAFPVRAQEAVFGFGDGSVRFVRIASRTEYRDADRMPAEVRERPAGDRFLFEGRIAERVGVDQFALRDVTFTPGESIQLTDGVAITAVDVSTTSTGPAFASVDAVGVLRVTQASTTRNFLTGKQQVTTESGELRLAAVAERGLPRWVMLRGLGDNAFAVWEDGHAVRVDVRDLAEPKIAEELDLVPGDDLRLATLAFLNGKNTLLVGDSAGGLSAWFRVPAPSMATGDGAHFIRAHEFERGSSAVTALASSPRTRVMAAGYADGTVRMLHATSDRVVAESRSPAGRPILALALAPDDSSLVAFDGAFLEFPVQAPHPEASLRALTRPLHYEGYARAEHVWQSSSGTDDFEPKFGLWPLVFGTLKATFCSMLFGVPIALMAAIYTSEFLHPEVKAVVKPAIEMMASLPSVVLGFLAALILAPLAEEAVPEVLTAVVTIPFTLLASAHLWQFLPGGRRAGLQGSRFLLAGLAILVGLAGAVLLGPVVEDLLFAGDLRHWLDGDSGTATGGWLFFTFPLSAVVAAFAVARVESRVLPHLGSAETRSLVAFGAGSAGTLTLALALAASLSAAGLDLRGVLLGTYVQRNAMVVGFVMAFAIVPIIYTIAEDALSSIPENLRAGSLALGATPWQTAVRIVVPTAMSGLFSAIMVGFGRAVGETMIVLMAAGNTPVLDWNLFNGFRTLSANIAVELPEAVRNGTHYRTLFLAALTLFVMTFVLNTAAELVRLRFRKRAQQL